MMRWGSGRLTLAEVLEPAAEVAEKGAPVARVTAHFWAGGVEKQLKQSANAAELLVRVRGCFCGRL